MGAVDHSDQICKCYTFTRKTEIVTEIFLPHNKFSGNKGLHYLQKTKKFATTPKV